MPQSSNALVALATSFLLGLSGCATLASDDHQSIMVTSDPPGAMCQVREGAHVVTVVNQTPATILVGKSRHDIAIDCEKPGYYPGAAVLQPHFQDWTLGNILYGGTIGLAVDTSTGAINEYPHWVEVLMKRRPLPGESADRLSQMEDLLFRLMGADGRD